MPLTGVVFAANSQTVLQALYKVVTFEAIAEILESMGIPPSPYVTPTTTYSNSFYTLGFKSSNPIIEMATMNYLLLILLVLLLFRLLYIAGGCGCCHKKIKRKFRNGEDFSNAWIRFVLEAFVEICLCIGIALL